MRSPGGPRFASFLDYMVRHRTAANLLLALMLIAGLAAGTQIRTQFFPDFVREEVDVDVSWPGAGPDDLDRSVVEILGPQLLAINGVDEATSVSREGRASINLEFEDGWDMGQATDEVKAAVDQARSSLPDGIEEPVVSRGVYRDRVTDVVIYGPVDIDQLARFAEDLQTVLFRGGVTRVSIQGLANPIIRINVGESMLVRHDLSLREIADVVSAEMETTPAGDVSGSGARLRTGQTRRSEQELGEIVLKAPSQGEKLQLRTVADIVTEGVESGRAYYHKGVPAVVLRVDRSAQGDTISIQRDVERITASFQETLPEGVVVQLTRTRSQNIIDRMNILIENGLFGLSLVLAFLFLFLSARTAFWVAAGIPVAMMATIGLMYAFGLTLNMVSVFALIICLGIVVDDAIVVGEHADSLHRRGYPPAEAASLAARRMTAPVFSASITTLIAFIGLIAIGGRFGTLIADIPFTVAVVLIASLVECFLILPAHMNHALSASKKQRWYDLPNRVFNRGFVWFREHLFRRFINWIITVRYPVLGFSVMILLLSLTLFMDGSVRWRFFNAPERSVVSASIAMMPGAERDDTKDMIAELERALDVVNTRYSEEYGEEAVLFALSTVGGTAGRGLRGADSKDVDQLGGISIELIDPDLRPYSAFQFIGDWRKEINRPPLLETLALRGERSGPGGDAIDVRLYGTSTENLKTAAESLKQALAPLDGVSALEDTLAYDKPELSLTLTPKGEALGFTTDDVARILRNRLEGIEVAEFPVGRRTAKVKVLMPDEETDASFLYTTRIRTDAGTHVSLSEIVQVDSSYGFASVRRSDGLRTLSVSGDVSEDDPEAASRVTSLLENELLPQLAAEFDVESEMSGLAEQEKSFLSDAMIGFALCLAGIYLTLCWIFESWTRPLMIMVIIPFGSIGMLWGHYIHGVPLSMFSVVGFIGMSGIIINDSIVLVTTIDEYARNHSFRQALVNGVCDRLRAVVLTTATTVFGLAPLLFETSRQAQFLKPTVITLSYGLGVGLFLVILLVPALLALQRDFGQSVSSGRRLLKAKGRRALPGGPAKTS
ncbi:efflux RND transporter permease subunit [Roseibium album]|uniref:Acriflavine resistance protein B n=1 Tax=Roseibium album TaxID=311410 RepID=A0A0M6ZC62_9HYPH|nr:efflux RND transporter permease subunit [Roseibium album]MBG6202258.1 multidrug efflux pump subunit AcrB [Labrenzia sp. EL_13]CTQ60027.1 Acriflavine resistance protein B [Roseibium album]CTQ77110.1 Acriflavine resistance protein B [Roseibium album]CTQ77435.1 Acriflavine resistance protein B [Roseibium album]